MRHVLSIAGSDSGGGAGIQADLKTMCALGVYGMTAITAVTAQNTQGVYGVQEIEPAMVRAQIEAVYGDIRVDAVKVGMVSGAGIIAAVREGLVRFGARNMVLDPVMVSKSGYSLLKREAEDAVRELAGIADIITPNIPEAEILAGLRITGEDDALDAAERIAGLGAKSVLIKGGHRLGDAAEDLFYRDGKVLRLPARRIGTRHTHGTGCTLSTAIACRLALGDGLEEAVRAAKAYITQAIADSYELGAGCGPVGHLAALYRRAGMETEAQKW
ncbi:MAG: bifunctional hydroxymethylpyrimidine kinase/phosphomethylpyrimidine kinase [Spirochaetaceae bacterium]|jgi:hydroxymethylpyrimidine/phosphomethylpyrimidine kinase|nr:bifunctional hydroxymethylpyrimidine kinase/phosphomethylpyrimidine kinase [Spirochaetaceae bacterium]